MKRILIVFGLLIFFVVAGADAGYKVGDAARDFSLKNVDGSMVSLTDYPDAKGFIVIFTCNHCPYSVLYEDRIIELHKQYASRGYPVIAINPNDPKIQPQDSFKNMIKRAEDKGFPFPYLFDETQKIASAYGATRTPHVFLLKKVSDKLQVAYIGAIDDSPKNADDVEDAYVQSAVMAVDNGETPDPDFTKAIGCSIKWKK